MKVADVLSEVNGPKKSPCAIYCLIHNPRDGGRVVGARAQGGRDRDGRDGDGFNGCRVLVLQVCETM